MSRPKTRNNLRGRRTSRHARLALQNLESRLAPANFQVVNAEDSGAGSFRQAILDANGTAGPDTIDFEATFFSSQRTISLAGASGQLTISDDLVITGPGAANLTVSGSNATRVFNVESSTAIINVTISDMTVTGGNASSGGATPFTADGGGIRTTNEILTLEDMVVTGNSTPAGIDGAGVSATSTAFITIRNSTVSGNVSGNNGGGIYFFNGGGLLLESSTVSGNTAAGTIGGGGLYFFGIVDAVGFTILNSTISGNSTAGSGGGLVLRYLDTDDAPVLIQNSTIANNSAGTTSTFDGNGGGGIAMSSAAAGGSNIVTIQSSIVSNNTASAANGRSDIATVPVGIVNIYDSAIGDADGFTITGSSGNLPTGSVLNLQPLGSYGGPTQTIALGSGSLAVGAGSNPLVLDFDQRGPGFPRQVGAAVDIGAFEGIVDFPIGTASALPNVTTAGGTSYPFTVTYTSGSPINTGTLDNNDVRITGPGGFNVLATRGTFNAGNPNAVIVNYSFTPPTGSWDGFDNGTYTVALQAGQVANNAGGTNVGATLGTFQVGIPTTYIVANLDDSGPGSLRQAILDSNASVGVADLITFQAGLTGTIPVSAALGQLTISDGVNITGPGAAALTIDGGGAVRVLNVERTGSVISVSISGLTISGGNGIAGGGSTFASDGGGIRTTDENLTLDRVVVTGNTASASGNYGNDGGGVTATSAANIVIRNSTISGNTATKNGGGIYFFISGSLLLENSTVSGNTAATGTIGGGGIYFYGTVAAGGFTISNSTIANNTAPAGSGGGIVLRSLNTVNAPILIQNSTIANNSAGTTSTTVGGGGGGIAISSLSFATGATAIMTITSSIVSGNTASAANGRSDIATIAASVVNVYNSAIGDEDGFTITGSGGNLPFGSALALQPLAGYGGPTATIALGAGSLALDAGLNTTPPLDFDQRGPGFPRQVGAAVDIGAFEGVVDFPVGTPSAFPNITTEGGTTYTFDVTYTSGSPINQGTLDNNDIRITGPGGFNVLATRGTINGGNPNAVIVTYSFAPPANPTAGWDDDDNGTYTVSLQAGQVANNAGATNVAVQLGTFQVAIPGIFTVTNLDDAGTGSLRQAILDANAVATPDIILFQAGLTGTITLTSGQLTISNPLTITGPGAAVLTVDGGGASRVFNVERAGSVISVLISGLTVSGGNGTTGGATPVIADGGAIRTTDENLTLDRVVVTGNTAIATGAYGNDGGGISATTVANIVIRNSTISGNTATKNGGGIYFFSGGSLLLENSTVSGNTAAGTVGGGGVYFFGAVTAGGVTISNSTIANNMATSGSGGGVVLRSLTGTVLMQNSTITGNHAGIASTTAGEGGGGVAISSGGTASILTLRSTIVSGNTSDAGNGNDDLSTIVPATVNAYSTAIGDPDGHVLSGASAGNLAAGAVLNLGTLGSNGGPTETISLGTGSEAINAGANATPALPFDQRGIGFNRDVGGVDIGAFEVQGGAVAPTVLTVQVNGGLAQRSRVTTLAVTFSAGVTFAGAVANAFTLRRNSDNAIVNFTATATTNGLGQTVVTLDNFVPGTANITEFGSLADGNYTLTTLANQVSAGGVNMAANDTFGDVVGDNFFRYYGDITGNRRVDIADFSFFSPAYLQGTGANNPVLDYNQDGRIDIADFSQFSVRYFTTLP